MCSYSALYSLFLIQLFLRSSYFYLFPIKLVPVFLSNTLCFLSDSSCFHPAILCFLSNYSLFPILLGPVSYPFTPCFPILLLCVSYPTTLCFLSYYFLFPILLYTQCFLSSNSLFTIQELSVFLSSYYLFLILLLLCSYPTTSCVPILLLPVFLSC